MVKTGLWLELETIVGFVVGLGVGSLIGQRTVGVVLMIILEIVLTPIFIRAQIPHLINVQRAVVGVATAHLEPGALPARLRRWWRRLPRHRIDGHRSDRRTGVARRMDGPGCVANGHSGRMRARTAGSGTTPASTRPPPAATDGAARAARPARAASPRRQDGRRAAPRSGSPSGADAGRHGHRRPAGQVPRRGERRVPRVGQHVGQPAALGPRRPPGCGDCASAGVTSTSWSAKNASAWRRHVLASGRLRAAGAQHERGRPRRAGGCGAPARRGRRAVRASSSVPAVQRTIPDGPMRWPYGGSACAHGVPGLAQQVAGRRAAAPAQRRVDRHARRSGCGSTPRSAARPGRPTSASSGRPASTDSISAQSATVVASGPFSAMSNHEPLPRSAGTTPSPGLMPTRPQHAAGMRIEPMPSLPCATATMPAATAAAAPPDEPPGVRSRSHGLRVMPKVESVAPKTHSSGTRVSPTTTAPAAAQPAHDLVVELLRRRVAAGRADRASARR